MSPAVPLVHWSKIISGVVGRGGLGISKTRAVRSCGEIPELKFQAPSKNPNPNQQSNVRPIEILGLGFVWDLVSWDLECLT
jgi:hypothetical protein